MRVLIEYYKFDTLIEGQEVPRKQLERMFKKAIKFRHNNYDEFANLFCRLYNYKIVKTFAEPVIGISIYFRY